MIDKLRLDIDSMQIQVNSTERTRLAEVSPSKTSNRDLTKEVTEKQRQLTRKNLEIDEIKEDYEEKLKRTEQRLEDEVGLLKDALLRRRSMHKIQTHRKVRERPYDGSLDEIKEEEEASTGSRATTSYRSRGSPRKWR